MLDTERFLRLIHENVGDRPRGVWDIAYRVGEYAIYIDFDKNDYIQDSRVYISGWKESKTCYYLQHILELLKSERREELC